jgi:hypothetical protein
VIEIQMESIPSVVPADASLMKDRCEFHIYLRSVVHAF